MIYRLPHKAPSAIYMKLEPIISVFGLIFFILFALACLYIAANILPQSFANGIITLFDLLVDTLRYIFS